MSFPRYPKYKDSGVEWLGAVPEHWSVKRIGYYFNERREKVSDKDFPALSVTKNGIVPQLDTAAKSDDGDNRKKVSKGDFVINSRSDRKGSAGVSAFDGSVSLICTVLRPQEQVDAPFVHHLLRCQPFQEEFYRYGKGIVADLWSTNYSEMRNILLGMPPLPEQSKIAAFLDRETAKIDELMAEQRRLMELLKEKCQAVISHAVTKGLDPNAPTKPSRIEWLGDMPAHWEAKPLGRITLSRCDGPFGSGLKSEHYSESGVRVIRLQNIRAEGFNDSDAAFIDKEYHDNELTGHEVVAGDVLIAGLGDDNNLVGRACVAPAGIEPAMVKADCFRFRLDRERALPAFVARVLSVSATFDAGMLATGTTRSRIPLTITSGRRIPLPPLAEQQAIAAHLDTELAKFDTLTAEAQRAIDLLQERRTALISAAVTGQIDVRSH
ncbi:MAG: restriction endonuclease subunit S [Pseudomonadota bacterium]